MPPTVHMGERAVLLQRQEVAASLTKKRKAPKADSAMSPAPANPPKEQKSGQSNAAGHWFPAFNVGRQTIDSLRDTMLAFEPHHTADGRAVAPLAPPILPLSLPHEPVKNPRTTAGQLRDTAVPDYLGPTGPYTTWAGLCLHAIQLAGFDADVATSVLESEAAHRLKGMLVTRILDPMLSTGCDDIWSLTEGDYVNKLHSHSGFRHGVLSDAVKIWPSKRHAWVDHQAGGGGGRRLVALPEAILAVFELVLRLPIPIAGRPTPHALIDMLGQTLRDMVAWHSAVDTDPELAARLHNAAWAGGGDGKIFLAVLAATYSASHTALRRMLIGYERVRSALDGSALPYGRYAATLVYVLSGVAWVPRGVSGPSFTAALQAGSAPIISELRSEASHVLEQATAIGEGQPPSDVTAAVLLGKATDIVSSSRAGYSSEASRAIDTTRMEFREYELQEHLKQHKYPTEIAIGRAADRRDILQYMAYRMPNVGETPASECHCRPGAVTTCSHCRPWLREHSEQHGMYPGTLHRLDHALGAFSEHLDRDGASALLGSSAADGNRVARDVLDPCMDDPRPWLEVPTPEEKLISRRWRLVTGVVKHLTDTRMAEMGADPAALGALTGARRWARAVIDDQLGDQLGATKPVGMVSRTWKLNLDHARAIAALVEALATGTLRGTITEREDGGGAASSSKARSSERGESSTQQQQQPIDRRMLTFMASDVEVIDMEAIQSGLGNLWSAFESRAKALPDIENPAFKKQENVGTKRAIRLVRSCDVPRLIVLAHQFALEKLAMA